MAEEFYLFQSYKGKKLKFTNNKKSNFKTNDNETD